MKKLLIFCASLFLFNNLHSQFSFVSGKFVDSVITLEREKNIVIVPIEIELKKHGKGDEYCVLELSIDTLNTTLHKSKYDLIIDTLSFFLYKGTYTKTYYLVINKDSNTYENYSITLTSKLNKKDIGKLRIDFIKPYNLVYTLYDYLNNEDLRLNNISQVLSNPNFLTVYGEPLYNQNTIASRKISLKKNQVFVVSNSFSKAMIPKVSLLTVPFKVRPKIGNIKTHATSGINNFGLNFEFIGIKKDRYFATGNKSQHTFGLLGLWIASSVQELDSGNTKQAFITNDEKTKQLFISMGLTLSYSYNDISFVLIPYGRDFGVSKIAKDGVYHNKYWFGFGIGISPNKLTTILNR